MDPLFLGALVGVLTWVAALAHSTGNLLAPLLAIRQADPDDGSLRSDSLDVRAEGHHRRRSVRRRERADDPALPSAVHVAR